MKMIKTKMINSFSKLESMLLLKNFFMIKHKEEQQEVVC